MPECFSKWVKTLTATEAEELAQWFNSGGGNLFDVVEEILEPHPQVKSKWLASV